MAPPPLPIDDHLDAIAEALASRRACVVVAPPGSGKTTRVPPAVAGAGRVVVLQPRRVAARAVARRIADEHAWIAGREVGWHVRFERRCTPETAVLIVTEGMLTAYLDDDPLIADVATLVLDEFHERSLHTDIGLALAKQAWRARQDLRIVVMSATMDPAPVAAFLDDCPVIALHAPAHPLDIEYTPGQTVAAALTDLLPRTAGNVLAFLPGAAEIEQAARDAAEAVDRQATELVRLHGSLDADTQDRALRAGPRRRVILATNIAETSLTVPGVSVVVDTGLQKVSRYDAERAIDALVLERVTGDSADQRAGRAARLGPGLARRLWDRRDRLRPSREPEIHRVDLAATVLSILASGTPLHDFEWFEPPDDGRVTAAVSLLQRLGALTGFTVTPLGHRLRRLPLHPRLGRLLLEGLGSFEAAAACALLSDRSRPRAASLATSCDLLPILDDWTAVASHTRQVSDQLQRLGSDALGPARRPHVGEAALRKAILTAYPDRVARRRSQDPTKVILASGRGARLGRDSHLSPGDWLVALDVTGDGSSEAIVRVGSLVDPEWIEPTSRVVDCRVDERGAVRATETLRYDAIVLRERTVRPEPEARARTLARAWLERDRDESTVMLDRRARAAGVELDMDELALAAAADARSLADIDVTTALPWQVRRAIDEGAPADVTLPSGRRVTLSYHEDGRITAAVKLQELFGLADTPRIGRAREPLVFELLAPNGRPVQTTRDLRSFWNTTYPEVRKQLRGRYPRHPWPEDPWTATPTHRTTRRS